MPRRTPAETLAALEKEQVDLKSEMAEKRQKLRETEQDRRKDLAARMRRVKARISSQERRQRTRRLILIGTLVEHELAENPKRRARFNSRLDAFLTRDRDRELFGLKPRGDGVETSGPPEASTAAAEAEEQRREPHEHAQDGEPDPNHPT
jgi:hypothetical protein